METALNADGGAVERLWLGSSTSGAINQYYFAPTLGASTDGVYRLGGGGNQGTMWIGFNAFENVLTGATSVQIGATVAGNGYNSPGVINGNTNITLNTRNNFTGGLTANRGPQINLASTHYVIGSGTLTVNHTSNQSVNIGQGQEGVINAPGISLWNNVDLVGDMRTAGTNFVLRGNVNLAPGGVAGTRMIEIAIGQGELRHPRGHQRCRQQPRQRPATQRLMLNGLNTYTGTTTLSASGTLPATGTTFAGILVGTDVLPTPGALGNSDTPLLINTG